MAYKDNELTEEELKEVTAGIKNGKTSISTRLNGQIKSPYKNTWVFEYCDE